MGWCGATWGLGLVCLVSGSAAAAACAPDTVELRWPGGRARFSVELADTPALRETGLMNRASLASAAGMLFAYPAPHRASFWMKNTLIPLDMIFADATGRVTRVHSDAVPQDQTPIDGGADVSYVLEINGGLAKRLGLPEGAEMRSAAMAQGGAVWPCAAE